MLRLLAGELAAAGSSVIVTTTTAMLFDELAAVGPVVLHTGGRLLADGLRAALAARGVAAAAAAVGVGGKVIGLSPEVVDGLWKGDVGIVADYVIVEADGSRGKPLKAFGPREPQAPSEATLIVQVAGLDAIAAPLDEEHVHRARVAAEILGVPLGTDVTPGLFAECLRLQLEFLARYRPSARLVTMLNKADGPDEQELGLRVAADLLGTLGDGHDCSPPRDRSAPADRLPPRDRLAPEAAVVASLRERRFVRLSSGEGAPW